MIPTAARDILVAAIGQVLGDAASGIRRRGDGTVVIPISLLESMVAAHVNLVSDSGEAIRALSEAISTLQQEREILIVEAPTAAVRVNEEFFELADGNGPETFLLDQDGDAADINEGMSHPAIGAANAKSDQCLRSDDTFRRRIQEAYPGQSLEFL